MKNTIRKYNMPLTNAISNKGFSVKSKEIQAINISNKLKRKYYKIPYCA
jgi:hypothetical protein